MEYKLSGNPADIAKVIQENRIRIQRGVISFTPLDCEVHTDVSAVIANLQDRCKELDDGYNHMSEELSEARLRANDLQATINKLKDAGVDIDLIVDGKPETADTKEIPEADTKEPEAVPESDTKAPKTKRTKKTE